MDTSSIEGNRSYVDDANDLKEEIGLSINDNCMKSSKEYPGTSNKNLEEHFQKEFDDGNRMSDPKVHNTKEESDKTVAYYKEIHDYITSQVVPEGVPEVYKKTLKKRAQNYKVIDGTLHYGHRQPRRVITERSQQKDILKKYHIEEETGAHLGLKSMYLLINQMFFWKGLYTDVANYAKHCEYCTENTHAEVQHKISEKCKQPQQENTKENSQDNISGNSSKVWQKVELKIYGPYPKTDLQNEFIITMADPFSRWLIARAAASNNKIDLFSDFICKSFCTFGFAKCGIVGLTQEMLNDIKLKYEESVSQLQETLLACGLMMPQVISTCETNLNNLLSLLNDDMSQCSWVGRVLEEYVEANPADWDLELEKFLFEYCTKISGDLSSPFRIMFGRSPVSNLEEDKENCNETASKKSTQMLYQRRKLQSSILQCRHCEEIFTSKISFRIHQRKHTEEACRQGTLEGQEPLPIITEREERLQKRIVLKRRKRLLKQGNLDRREWLLSISNHKMNPSQESLPKDQSRAELQANTVAAVRELMALTKEQRRRRGKYQKYPEDLQEEMARYSIEHGSLETVRHFSEQLGTTVSESTIRDIVKLYRAFTPELKEEIGQFAERFGVDMASSHFTERLGQEVRRGWVRRFKKLYLNHHPEIESKQLNNNEVRKPNSGADNAAHKNKFTPELKDEIGAYACQFGITAAIEHYSQKMLFPPKKCTIRKFRKLYLEKHSSQQPMCQQQLHQNSTNNQESGGTSMQTIDILHSSLNVLNSVHASNVGTGTYNNSCQSNLFPNFQSSTQTFSGSHVPNPSAYPFQPISSRGTVSSVTMPFQQHTSATPTAMNQNSVTFSHDSPVQHNLQHSRQGYSPYNSQLVQDVSSHKPFVPPPMPHPSVQVQSHILHQSTTQPAVPCSEVLTNNYGTISQPQQIFEHPPNHETSVAYYHTNINDMRMNSHNPTHDSNASSLVHQFIPSSTIPSHTHQEVRFSHEHQQKGEGHHQQQIQHQEELSQPSFPQQTEEQPGQQEHQLQVPLKLKQKPSEDLSSDQRSPQKRKSIRRKECTFDEDSDAPSVDATPKKKSRRGGRSPKKKQSSDGQKRGNYTLFSPELRAEIGKYAAEHGSRRACRHFSEILGHVVPESTICGLRDKYLLVTGECEMSPNGEKDITSLNYGPRGRPRRLGKYDEVVEECIRDLVKSGERVSSFLAIATAKQVLMQFEPGLLEENGGNVKLNVTWAKSFLKRIGVQNSS